MKAALDARAAALSPANIEACMQRTFHAAQTKMLTSADARVNMALTEMKTTLDARAAAISPDAIEARMQRALDAAQSKMLSAADARVQQQQLHTNARVNSAITEMKAALDVRVASISTDDIEIRMQRALDATHAKINTVAAEREKQQQRNVDARVYIAMAEMKAALDARAAALTRVHHPACPTTLRRACNAPSMQPQTRQKQD